MIPPRRRHRPIVIHRALVAAALTGATLLCAPLVATPPDAPLAAPDYSFDRSSPAVARGFVQGGDVLLRTTRPRPALRGQALGLTGNDDIDALSGPNPDVQAPDVLGMLFSVDRETIGVAAPDPLLVLMGLPYNVADQAARGHAAGDQFIALDPFRRDGPGQPLAAEENNVLVRNNFDEGGTDFSAWPPTHASSVLNGPVPQDRVDAMGVLPRRETDGRIHRLYFSLTATSPSLAELANGDEPSGADIFFATAAPIRGACCLSNGQCIELPESTCVGEGGTWRGADTNCELCAMEMGACCIDGECVGIARFQCAMMEGQFFEGVPCHEIDCVEQQRGACCLGPGFCVDDVTSRNCTIAGGAFFAWMRCADTPCFDLALGSCCISDGCVAPVDDVICHALGGAFFRGRDCKEVDCERRGACCLPEMCVDAVNPEPCEAAGGVFHEGLMCEDVVCGLPPRPPVRERDPKPKVFRPDASFPIVAYSESGDPGEDTKTSITCEPPAACCFAEGCMIMDSLDCGAAGGVWIEGYVNCAVCTTVGACCLPGGNCVLTRAAPCENADGRWLGPGEGCASCDGDGNPGEVWRFASSGELGLLPEDEIDAMVVFDDNENGLFDGGDIVLFSLAPGSRSLLTIPNASPQGAAADIFMVRPGASPAVFARARMLGLGAAPDNVDALNLVIEPEPGGANGIRRCEFD